MENMLNTRNKIVHICSCIAIWLVAVLFAVLSAASIWQTCRIDPANPYAEIVNFDNDLVLTNLSLIGLTVLGALFMLRKKVSLSQVSVRFTAGVMLLVSTIISLAWVTMVKSVSSGDAMILLNTARDAANNSYQSFHSSYNYYGNHSYYLFYPFQLGYVFFAEIMFRVFGAASSDMLLQYPNIIALGFVYTGVVMIAHRLFKRRSVTNLTSIALTFCFQPMFMTTFTYGILLGLAFSVWSVYHTVRYMQDDKLKNAVLAAVLIAVSVLLKYNNMIVLAAICIALILHATDKKRILAVTLAAAMILCSVGLQKLVIFSYAQRSGAQLNTQVSQTMYAYMGISESGMAPGWYNGKAMETLRDNNMDVAAADKAASEGIQRRLGELTSAGQLGEFLKKKLFSQLNEPSFESIWLSQVREHKLEEGEILSPIASSVYTGGLNTIFDNWFNYYNMIIYISFAAGMIWLMRRRKLSCETLILPVAVLGGVMYHMIFEAKSQYLLPYFVLMIPFAVYGFIESIRAVYKKSGFLFK